MEVSITLLLTMVVWNRASFLIRSKLFLKTLKNIISDKSYWKVSLQPALKKRSPHSLTNMPPCLTGQPLQLLQHTFVELIAGDFRDFLVLELDVVDFEPFSALLLSAVQGAFTCSWMWRHKKILLYRRERLNHNTSGTKESQEFERGQTRDV